MQSPTSAFAGEGTEVDIVFQMRNARRNGRLSAVVVATWIRPRTRHVQEAFRTERAQRAGMANAASGRIMVTCAGDHFGPILAEHDPERGLVRRVATCL